MKVYKGTYTYQFSILPSLIIFLERNIKSKSIMLFSIELVIFKWWVEIEFINKLDEHKIWG